MRLLGYVRVSRVGDREDMLSHHDQRARIEGFASAHGHTIIDVLEDIDESGGKWERAKFQRALDLVRDKAADGIVVFNFSRFARSLAHALDAIEVIESAGGTLLSVQENFDPSTPTGKMMRDFFFSIAEWDRAVKREAFEMGRRYAVSNGIHVSAIPPFGYCRKTKGAKPDGRPIYVGPLLIDPVAGPLVREVFLRRVHGARISELAAFLRERGAVTPRGSTNITDSMVNKIIRNRVYCGEARSGEFVHAGAHTAIVSEAEFEAANKVGRASRGDRSGHAFMLGGVVRCAGCSFPMRYRVVRSIPQYNCHGGHSYGRCDQQASVTASVIEPWVEAAFLQAAKEEALYLDPVLVNEELGEAEAAHTDAEDEMRAFMTLTSALDPFFIEGKQVREGRLQEARDRLADVQARRLTLEGLPSGSLRDLWPSLSIEEKAEVLRAVIDAVFVAKLPEGASRKTTSVESRAAILWRGEAPLDLPGRGRAGFPRPYDVANIRASAG